MSKVKVLVVEDNPDWRKDLYRELTDEGYEVETAASFSSAKEMLKTTTYTVVTVDLNLDESAEDDKSDMKRDGERVLRFIKQNHPLTRCIVVSGSITSKREMRDLLKEKGAFDCISKPEMDWILFLQAVEDAVKDVREAQHMPHLSADTRPTALTRDERRTLLYGNARIFISYRRTDSQAAAGRIYDRLRDVYGEEYIFRDVDNIDYGVNFVKALQEAVTSCDVLIALIGTQWLTASGTDASGKTVSRLFLPDDYVRNEISAALQRNIKLIPVLLDGATMPSPSDLPDVLQPLVYINAMEIRNDHNFETAIMRLIYACAKTN